eukprot:4979042-Pyramimonas_sp.AAC.1
MSAVRSHMFQPKHSGSRGIKGQRILHCYDALGMSFYGQLLARTKRPVPRDIAHGGNRGRRREGCLLALSSAAWRCRDAGVSHALANFDGTNAFACTKRDCLHDLHESTAPPERQ